jgi:putative ABC transport system permease protein
MRVFRITREGIRSLLANKLRTFFMMAGTIVGITALIVIMAVGKGTEKKIMKRVNNFGPRAMMLIAGGGKDLPPPDMTITTLTLDDAEAVREQIDNVEIVSPMAWNFQMSLKHETSQWQATVWGVEPNWNDAWDWYTVIGEGIADQDVSTMARVCVIGQTVKRELFGNTDPLGQRLYINKVSFTVKGLLEKRGTSPMGSDFDNRVILPITTAMRRVMNIDHLGAIRIITKDTSFIPAQDKAIRALIHERHHITPPQEDDFRIISALIIAELARGISGMLSILLISLAALSLIVGGVVLMNILLISVAERTREIGLRRALGATGKDIFMQFLAESLTVTLLGMFLGSLLGWGVCFLLPRITETPVVLSWEPFALAVGFALIVGTFFGVQPARRAARLNPVEALR